MTPCRAYVVGAGLAGLSASVALADAGLDVELIEAAPQAGGRCRSYFDSSLGQIIDNGNHLVLSGNHATMAYVRRIGAEDALIGPSNAATAFADLATGTRWMIRPDDGPLPLWLLDPSKRVPGTSIGEYAALGRLLAQRRDRPLGEVLRTEGALWERLLRPFFLSALNIAPEEGSSMLAARLVRETFAKGGRAYCARIAHPTLAAAFVEPALVFLAARGAKVRLGERVRRILRTDREADSLHLADDTIPLAPTDIVVLATPPWVTRELLPEVPAPDRFCGILNAHFRVAPPRSAPPMLGILGGTAEWLFCFPDRVSVTVSGADRLMDVARERLAETLWADVAVALGIGTPMPPWQIVKEKRATFAATSEQNRKRPPARTRWSNILLAGDWTDTGLPSTIEGAIRSGHRAAKLALDVRAV